MVLTIVMFYVIFLKPMLLSGKNKMVTSGYDKVLRWDGSCVLFNTFIQFFSLLNLTNIPDALLNPVKVY